MGEPERTTFPKTPEVAICGCRQDKVPAFHAGARKQALNPLGCGVTPTRGNLCERPCDIVLPLVVFGEGDVCRDEAGVVLHHAQPTSAGCVPTKPRGATSQMTGRTPCRFRPT